MKILSMKLINFKGIREGTFDFPGGGNFNIYGTNGAGKTTIVDALIWLLFDKDSADTKDFGIKTIVDGEPLHHAEHSVECVFLMENGISVTLRKEFQEKWQKARGKKEKEFTGHTTSHYIDGVPKSQTAYKNYINSIIDEKRFKTLTNPLYFNEKLNDSERRAILIDIIGGVDQNAIIEENPELAELKPLLKGRKVEDYKLIVKQSLSKTNKEIDDIAPAIKENQAMINADADEAGKARYEEEVRSADEEIAVLIRQIAEAKAGTVDMEQEKKKAEISKALRQAQEEEAKADRERRFLLQKAVDEAAAASLNAENVVYSWDRVIKDLEQQVNSCERIRESLLVNFNNTKKRVWVAEPIKTKCPTCGQDIPADRVEAAKRKQEEQEKAFNAKRAEHLKQINIDGQKNNEAKNEAKQKLDEAVRNRANAVTDLNIKMDREKAAIRERDSFNGVIFPEVERLEKMLAELEKQEKRPDEAVKKRIEHLEAKRQALIVSRNETQKKWNDIEQNRKHLARIEELRKKEAELSITYAELKKQSYLCDQYSRCLTSYIDRKVGEHFQLARFVLFKDNISNEGVKECCEVQLHGTPYHDLCQTEQLHVGLDIINTLCRYYKMTMPVLIDRSESFVTLPETDMQIIRLIVSADDQELRVEKA